MQLGQPSAASLAIRFDVSTAAATFLYSLPVTIAIYYLKQSFPTPHRKRDEKLMTKSASTTWESAKLVISYRKSYKNVLQDWARKLQDVLPRFFQDYQTLKSRVAGLLTDSVYFYCYIPCFI